MANENENIPLNPEYVYTAWECSNCGDKSECNMSFLIQCGNPYCAECDQDMSHKSTYVPFEYLQKVNHDTIESDAERQGFGHFHPTKLVKNSDKFD